MGRKPSGKPWLHAPTGYWCVTLGGKREYLDKDYQVAVRKLKALIARRKRELAGGREWLDQPFSVLADEHGRHKGTKEIGHLRRCAILPSSCPEESSVARSGLANSVSST